MEDGLISGVIAEVAKGMSQVTVAETPKAQPTENPVLQRMKANAFSSEQTSKLQEHKSKLMSAIGGSAYNGVDLFEGTSAAPAQSSPQQQSSPLAGQPPADPGVDIANLFGSVGNHWNAHMNEMKERE